MNITIKALLDTRREKSDKSYPLVMRITYNRKTLNVSLGYSLFQADWDNKKQMLRSSSKTFINSTHFNNLIKKKIAHAYGVLTKLDETNELLTLSSKDVRAKILGNESTSEMSVICFIEQEITALKTAGKNGNALVYKTLRNKLVNYCGHDRLMFPQVTYCFLKKLETDHYAHGFEAGGLSVYMRTLRAVYNKAIKSNVVSKDHYPFNDYKIKGKKPVHKALSEADFNTLKDIDLSDQGHLQRSRDLYLVSFYLRGMNWMDIAFLRKENLIGDYDRLIYIRKKTAEPFNIKITQALQNLIKQYECQDSDFLFPILQGVKDEKRYNDVIRNKRLRLNQYLKRIATMVDIKPFSIYSARHTYATMSKRKGVPTAVIQQALGQATEAITQTYLDSFENSTLDNYDEIVMG